MSENRRNRLFVAGERRQWNSILSKLKQENLSSREIEHILDELHKITLPTTGITKSDCSNMASLLSQCVPPSSELLSAKLSQLITTFCLKLQVVYTHVEIRNVLSFLTQFIEQASPWFQREALQTLGYFLFDNGAKCHAYQEDLFRVLSPLIQPTVVDLCVRRGAISCFGNLLLHSSFIVSLEQLERIFSVMLTNLLHTSHMGDDINSIQLTSALLRTINIILSKECNLLGPRDIELLQGLKKFIVFHLDACILRDNLCESKHGSPIEESFDERAQDFARAKVRVHALQCLKTVCKTHNRTVTLQWHSFLSERRCPIRRSNEYSIVTIVLHDPHPKVRISAWDTLSSILDASHFKLWLGLVSNSQSTHTISVASPRNKSQRQFGVSLQERTHRILCELHFSISEAISKESDNSVFVYMMQCCCTLLQTVPYEKMNTEECCVLLSCILEQICKVLQANTATIAKSIMQCLSSLLNVRARVDNFASIMDLSIKNHDFRTEAQEKFVSALQNIVQKTMEFACSPPDTSIVDIDAQVVLLRSEALGVLSKFCRQYTTFLNPHSVQLLEILYCGFGDVDNSIRAAALHILEEILKPLETRELDNSIVSLSELITAALPRALLDTTHTVRTNAISCFGYLAASHDSWTILSAQVVDQVKAAVLNSMRDDAANTRMNSCKACTNIASIVNDIEWENHVVEQMLSLLQRDTNLNVRVRAATSLAVIFTNHSKNQESCVVSSPYSHLHTTQSRLHVLSSEQVHITADILLSALSDHDRVCSHVIRSLTVLVSYCMSQNSLEQSRGLIHRILVALGIQFNSAQAKVRWNACVAAGNMIGLINHPIDVQTTLIELTRVIRSFSNSKVQINAAKALAAPQSREIYGTALVDVWHALLDTLQALNDDSGAVEVKYRDELELQLQSLLIHLIHCTERKDFLSLKALLVPSASLILAFLRKAKRAQSPVEEKEDSTGKNDSESPFSLPQVHQALIRMTKLFEMHIRSINVDLLEEFQKEAGLINFEF